MPDKATFPTLPHLVYYNANPSFNGEPVETSGGAWLPAPYLRAESVTLEPGDKVGNATLSLIPEIASLQAIETALAAYQPHTQIRIVSLPMDDESVAQGTDINDGYILHEGLLQRRIGKINSQSGESVTFVTEALPAAIDNRLPGHVVTGRWCWASNATIADPDTLEGKLLILADNNMPPVFNLGDKPNMSAQVNAIKATSPTTIPANVFTYEGDPTAKHWTVREALLSLIVVWLLGAVDALADSENNLPRHTGIDAETLTQLMTPAPGNPTRTGQWVGLDETLPETDVTGLGVLSAIKAVCQAGGFECAVEPKLTLASTPGSDAGDASEGGGDRSYNLRIWHRGTGPTTWLNLAKRNTSFSSVYDRHAQNDMNQMTVMFDNAEIVNQVTTNGREMIEGYFDCKPLWSPDEVAEVTATAELLEDKPTDEQLDSHAYFSKHHPKGSAYIAAALRHWGLVTTPSSRVFYDPPETPESGANYSQEASGYDFVSHLGLNSSTAFLARDHDGDEATVTWMRRKRLAKPLQSAWATSQNLRYKLQVSEDGGVTFADCYVPCKLLADEFGFAIDPSINMASINNASFPTGDPVADVSTSWFALIQNQQLIFRLLCCVEADHGLRYTATNQSTSGTPYARQALDLAPADLVHVWQAPTHPANDSEDYASANTAMQALAKSRAQTLRDRYELTRVSGNVSTFRMDLVPNYKLGYRVAGIKGRNISFAADRAGSRFPSISGITYKFSGEDQGIQMVLTDTRMGGLS